MAARYSLLEVRAAALDGNVEFDEARALHTTTPFFGTLLEVHQFARDVLLALEEADWRKCVQLEPPHDGWYDVYEKSLAPALCGKHGVPSDWYLKLRLIEGLYGSAVFLVSLHQPEHPFSRPAAPRRRGGRT